MQLANKHNLEIRIVWTLASGMVEEAGDGRLRGK